MVLYQAGKQYNIKISNVKSNLDKVWSSPGYTKLKLSNVIMTIYSGINLKQSSSN